MSTSVRPIKRGGILTGRFMADVSVNDPITGEPLRDRKTFDTPALAKAWSKTREKELARNGQPKLKSTITVSDWYALYFDAAEEGTVGRKNRGRPQIHADDRRTRFRIYIEPWIGRKLMCEVTADDLRDLVRRLDNLVRLRVKFYEEGGAEERTGAKPGLAWKSALHVWSEVTSGFREALSSKHRELRVLDVDVTRAVQPPIKTDERQQAALYPAEALALLACEEVPLERKRVYAMALYIGGRLSEIAGITADDVDFEHGLVTVNGRKTQAARRRVPIDPALHPLLQRLVKERPSGPLVHCPPADGGRHGAADNMRIDMRRAKLTRKDLWRDDAEQAPFTFHGLRHTAITWWYVAGKDATFLKICAGHTSSVMTQRYLDTVAMSRKTFGQPHPPLPASVLGGGKVIPLWGRESAG
ncbi:MAG: hypothetical protein JWN02_1299 [Acidobacteria bacterium]|nr:hypothetical protein [Acidobacteriota bacterium]